MLLDFKFPLMVWLCLSCVISAIISKQEGKWLNKNDNFLDQNFQVELNNTANIPAYELSALHDLYNSTHGSQWRWKEIGQKWDFSANANPCVDDWQGITCWQTTPPAHSDYNNNNTYVKEINLQYFNLNGTIPDSIGVLREMDQLDFSENLLTGTIPSSIGNLSSLATLFLYDNNISGTLSHSLGQLASILEINVEGNALSGPLPVSFASIASLEAFLCRRNAISGSLFPALSNLTNLAFFSASYNALTGSIPQSFGALQFLAELFLADNHLTGPVPESMGFLPTFTGLDISRNRFTGTFPGSFSANNKMTLLSLSANRFTGLLPSVISSSKHLLVLALNNNEFSGTIPDSMGDLSHLHLIDLGGNCLTGSIPPFLSSLKLSGFNLESNLLTGTIPPDVSYWYNLSSFVVSDNKLTGPIPDLFYELKKVEIVSLFQNFLTSTIPLSFANISRLQNLYLSVNYLSGTVPVALGRHQPHLQYISMNNNQLYGNIPNSLQNALFLLRLDLAENHISGHIPDFLNSLKHIVTLQLNGNKLSGSLQGKFNADTNRVLSIVQVSSNRLTGTIPSDLFLLPALTVFIAADNCFHGTLPPTVCGAVHVKTMVLDGLSSSSFCLRRIFPLISNSYSIRNPVSGTIPVCLLTLPNINTLHLSGNGFTGTLPSVDTANGISPVLVDMSASHNIISGTIPSSILERSWLYLDLSFNRIGGSLPSVPPVPAVAAGLDGYIESSSSNTADTVISNNSNVNSSGKLLLDNNRLSGNIPGALKQRDGVSILGTNIFSCRLDGSDLPEHDPDKDAYQCGSDSFNVAYYIWMGLVVLMCGLAAWIYYQDKDIAKLGFSWLERVSMNNGYVMHQLHCVLKTSIQCSRANIFITIYALVVLLPTYVMLSASEGTFLHQYAWSTSAAYLSGGTATVVEMIVWVFLLVVLLWFLSKEKHSGAGSSYSTQNNNDDINTDRTEDSNGAGGESVKDKIRMITYATLFILTDIIVVAGVNVAYVYVAIYQSTSLLVLAQFSVSLFKLLWNNYGAESLRKAVGKQVGADNNAFSMSGMFHMQLIVSLMNNIVIPCAVVACISPNCFYNVFVPAPSVSSTYSAPKCLLPGVLSCDIPAPGIYSVTYNPPFRYSYQCSSSLISYYSPAFIMLCIVSTVLMPLAETCAVYLQKWDTHKNAQWYQFLIWNTPRILKPPDSEPTDRGRYFRSSNFIVMQITYSAMVLTFGVVFPPLTIAFTMSAIVAVFGVKVKVGRFLCVAEAQGHLREYIATIEQNCRAVAVIDALHNAAGMLVTLSCLFYTLFLFDTLGDAYGFKGAYWVLFVMPLLPLLLYVSYTYFSNKHIGCSDRDRGNAEDSCVELKTIQQCNPGASHADAVINVLLNSDDIEKSESI